MVRIEFATKDRYRGRRQNGPGAGAIAARSRAPVVAVASRHPERAKAAAEFIGRGVVALAYSQLPSRANHLLIAVPDRAVAQVATMLAGAARGVALHTCGAYGPEALGPLAGSGVSCGSLHPLQTVATAEQGVADLPGVAFAVEGDGPAAIWAREIVDLLEGRVLQISADCRPLYHAAAVMASNYLVGLIDAAAILIERRVCRKKTRYRLWGRSRGPVSRTRSAKVRKRR